MKKTYDRRQFLKGIGALSTLFLVPGVLAQGYNTKEQASKAGLEALVRAYPDDFAGLKVPMGKPFAAKPVGQTPKGTSLLIRIEKEQPLHYHKTHTEVAFCVQGEGYAEVNGEKIPLGPGLGVLIPPDTAHAFYGQMDLLSRFSPQLAGDVVFVKEGRGPAAGKPLAFTYQTAAVPEGKGFSAKPLANQELATAIALNISSKQPLHYHKSKDEAIYVVKGEGDVTVEGQRHPVKPGSIVLVPARARHELTGGFEALSVFTPALAGDIVFVGG